MSHGTVPHNAMSIKSINFFFFDNHYNLIFKKENLPCTLPQPFYNKTSNYHLDNNRTLFKTAFSESKIESRRSSINDVTDLEP